MIARRMPPPRLFAAALADLVDPRPQIASGARTISNGILARL
jgi:hypothetical protein